MVFAVSCLVVGCQAGAPERSRTGLWQGTTTQGLPIDFVVGARNETILISEWRVHVDLRCEDTDAIVHARIGGGSEIAIQDGQFVEQTAGKFIWNRFAGKFAVQANARGELVSIWPALIGAHAKELGTEKCAAPAIGWTARPSGEANAAAAAPLDFDLYLERDREGRIRTTVTRLR